MGGLVTLVIIILVALLFIVIANVKVVPQAHAYIIERLGAY